jgi:hypothetical protein
LLGKDEAIDASAWKSGWHCECRHFDSHHFASFKDAA